MRIAWLRFARVVQVNVRSDADREPEVDPCAVLFPATHWDGVQAQENVRRDCLDGLGPEMSAVPRLDLGPVRQLQVKPRPHSVVTRRDRTDCKTEGKLFRIID